MPGVLIVAYGNPMRCDDGLAWRAADELERKLSGSEIKIGGEEYLIVTEDEIFGVLE